MQPNIDDIKPGDNEANVAEMENLVVVRIWTSGHHHTHPGEDVGHISLHMPNIKQSSASASADASSATDATAGESPVNYISFWPKRATTDGDDPSSVGGPGIFKPEPGRLLRNPTEDIRLEGRRPELIFYLHFFDTASIIEKFEATKGQLDGWALLGANVLYPTTSHSCATLAAAMLKAGDVNDFFTSGSVTSVTSPDQLSEAISAAKRNELKKFQQQGVPVPTYPDETDVSQPVRKCHVM